MSQFCQLPQLQKVSWERHAQIEITFINNYPNTIFPQ